MPDATVEKRESILTPSYFRHNFATLLYEAGYDLLEAIEIFGHKDVKILLDVYAELREKHRKKGIRKIDHIFPR